MTEMSEGTGGLYECHGHLMMDGADFRAAWARHRDGVDTAAVRGALAALRDAGVVWFRDGGDALGVSARARALAPEYGIGYVTPVFAIHRQGYYGSIVGRAYADPAGYRALVRDARAAGADFIKLMFSGIITFDGYGRLSCPSLPAEEIRALVEIAHGAGFAVMAHVNGADAVRAAVEAGTDSVEHGYFMDRECLARLAASETVWVPTLAAAAAFVGRPGFDAAVAARTLAGQQQAVRLALSLGARVAAGSDSGAVGVPHGEGTAAEYRLLAASGASPEQLDAGNRAIRDKFTQREGQI